MYVGISAKLPDISRPQFHLPPLGALAWWHVWRRLVAKVGTSNQYRTISLKRLQCVVENNNNRKRFVTTSISLLRCQLVWMFCEFCQPRRPDTQKSRRYGLTFLNESDRVAAKVIGHAFLLFSFECQVRFPPYAYSCRLNRPLIAAVRQNYITWNGAGVGRWIQNGTHLKNTQFPNMNAHRPGHCVHC